MGGVAYQWQSEEHNVRVPLRASDPSSTLAVVVEVVERPLLLVDIRVHRNLIADRSSVVLILHIAWYTLGRAMSSYASLYISEGLGE